MYSKIRITLQKEETKVKQVSWLDKKQEYEQYVRLIDPSIKLISKDHWFFSLLGFILQIISFGQYKKEDFINNVAVTIGSIQAYPKQWPELSYEILTHESQHVKQYRMFSLGLSPWIGLPLFGVAYLFLFFPVGLAWCRYRLELAAEKTVWWMLISTGRDSFAKYRKDKWVEKITSVRYLWSVPKFVAQRGADRVYLELKDRFADMKRAGKKFDV